MKRKELQNLFPPVPGHFLDRIDRTMEEIEAMNTNSIKRIRRVSRPVLIAAIVFALTAATALPQYWTAVQNGEDEMELVTDVDDPVATLTPVYSEEIHETELEEQERFEAIRDWKPGDATQTVYATNQGSYYHCKPDCGGMMGSKAIPIEDALAAGKPACPVCIGGHNSRVVDAEVEFSD